MDTICLLTDKEVLGTEGLSSAAPRYTARAIVKNEQGLYAVMYSEKFNLYSLPGGGIEDGEDSITALRREILEETGCSCDQVEELGIVIENRFSCNCTRIASYYAVTTGSSSGKLHLTQAEIALGTSVQWHTFEEVLRLIRDGRPDTPQKKFIQARDLAALHVYQERCFGRSTDAAQTSREVSQ